jgi:tetratricopeptide (TPR) repeat protein
MITARLLLISSLAAATGTAVYYGPAFPSLDRMSTGSIAPAPATWDKGNRLSLNPIDRPAIDRRAMEVAQALPPAQPGTVMTDAPATPLTAQAPAPTSASTPPAAAQADAAPVVDEGALRYFARLGDTARVQAEIARLKKLYPNWVPPEDPLSLPQGADTQLESMWALYGQGRYADVRKAITDRQTREPSWAPPANLLSMLTLGEARQRFVNASNLQQYPVVVEVAAATPELLVCTEVDNLWRLGEAFARTDRPQRALDAYNYVLTTCTDSRDRLSTLQKAASLLPRPMVETLLTHEKTDASGKGEFEPVKDDLARQFVADAGKDTKLTVPPVFLTRMERTAETSGKASDALLLGWYYVRRDVMDQAETWFRRARTTEDGAAASQGLALTLIAKKDPRQAEAILYPWRADSDDTKATYLAAAANLLSLDPPIVIEAEVLQRIAQEATAARSSDVAQQFGWYARAFEQPQLALQWFSTALTWKTDSEPAAYGLAITANQLDMVADVERIQSQWAGRSPRIASLGEATPSRTAPASSAAAQARPTRNARAAAAEGGDRPAARRASPARAASSSGKARGCSGTTDPTGLSAGEALRHGWCLMELNRPLEAARSFDAAIRNGDERIRSEGAYGQSLAYLRQGLTDKAAVAAARGPLDPQKATELQVALLSDRAIKAFDAKRFPEALVLLDRRAQLAPERIDLMIIRGYAYLGMNRYAQAIRTFESLVPTGNSEAIRGLANARAALPTAAGGR